MSMSEQIIEVLNYFAEKVGIAIDWTAENILPYFQSLLAKYQAYAIAENAIWIAVCIVGIVGCIIWGKKAYSHHLKLQKNSYYCDDEFFVGGTIIGIIIISVASIVGLMTAIISLVRWCIVPEFQFFDMITCCL